MIFTLKHSDWQEKWAKIFAQSLMIGSQPLRCSETREGIPAGPIRKNLAENWLC